MHKIDPVRRAMLLAAAASAAGVRAQTPAAAGRGHAYPAQPIRFIVNSQAGGSPDVMTRLVTQRLADAWKHTVIVDNRPGASGTIGADAVAKAAADGHTLLVSHTSLIQTPFLMPRLPYDPFKDLVPVLMMARGANIFLVPASSPARTLQEYVAMVKATPGKHSYGSYGNATTGHIWADTFVRLAGLDVLHVPYRSGQPMMMALLASEVGLAVPDVASAMPHLNAGKVRALAITGTTRYKSLPDVPTLSELGYKGLEPYGWYGIFAPAATPRDVVDRLSTELARIVRSPDVTGRFHDLGLTVTATPPDTFAAEMRADAQVWGRAIRDGNIRAD